MSPENGMPGLGVVKVAEAKMLGHSDVNGVAVVENTGGATGISKCLRESAYI